MCSEVYAAQDHLDDIQLIDDVYSESALEDNSIGKKWRKLV